MPLFDCICTVDGAVVGSCADQGPHLGDPVLGCCGTLLFGPQWW